MAKLTVYYSVNNGGDGSASTVFFESKALAEWHQEWDCGDGWGEPCTGSLTIKGKGPLTCEDMFTKESYREEVEERDDPDMMQSFLKEFFTNS